MTVMLATTIVGTLYAADQPQNTVIPKYTVVPVILDDTISTKKNKTGDKVEVHCVGKDCGGFPSGTTFVGVLNIQPATGNQPGKGSVQFVQAVLPDERKIAIQAVPSSAEGVKTEGQTGKKSKKQAQTTGAIIGAGIGGIAGGFGGAVIGGAAGLGAGSLTKGKGKDIEVKAGTKGYITMLKPVTITPAPPQPKQQNSTKSSSTKTK